MNKILNLTKRTFTSTSVSAKNFREFKFLHISNTPIYWNEDFLNNQLNNAGIVNFIKKIQKSNSSFYSQLPTTQTNEYLVGIDFYNEKDSSDVLNKIANIGGENIHISLSKSIETEKVKKSLILLSNEGRNIFENVHLKRIFSDEDLKLNVMFKSLNTKNSVCQVYFKKNTFLEKIKIEMKTISNVSYWIVDGINKILNDKDLLSNSIEINKLKLIQNRISILSLRKLYFDRFDVKRKEAEDEIELLIKEKEKLNYVLKEKENLKKIKNYMIIGNSGVLIYDK